MKYVIQLKNGKYIMFEPSTKDYKLCHWSDLFKKFIVIGSLGKKVEVA